MCKFLLIFFVFVSITTISKGQTKQDTVKIHPKPSMYNYSYNGEYYNHKEIRKIVEKSQATRASIRQAKLNLLVGNVIVFGSSFCFGYTFMGALHNNNGWELPLFSAVTVLSASYVFGIAYKRHLHNAIQIYNSEQKASKNSNVDLSLGITSKGFGLTLTF